MKAFVVAFIFATLALCEAIFPMDISLNQLKTNITEERQIIATEIRKAKAYIEDELWCTAQGLGDIVYSHKADIAAGSYQCKSIDSILNALMLIYEHEHYWKECEMESRFDMLRNNDKILEKLYFEADILFNCLGRDYCQSRIDEIQKALNELRKIISKEFVNVFLKADDCRAIRDDIMKIQIEAIWLRWEKCEDGL